MTDGEEGAKEKSVEDLFKNAFEQGKKMTEKEPTEDAQKPSRLMDLLEKSLSVLDKAVDMRAQENAVNPAPAPSPARLPSDTFKNIFTPTKTNGAQQKTTKENAETFKNIFTQENHRTEAAEAKKNPPKAAEKTADQVFKKAFDTEPGGVEKESEEPASGVFKDPFEKSLIVSEIEKRLEKKVAEEEKPAPAEKPAADAFRNIFAQGKTSEASQQTKPAEKPSAEPQKPAADMFKNIFAPTKTPGSGQQTKPAEKPSAEPQKPAADMFKNVFAKSDVLSNAEPKKPAEAAEKPAETTKMPIADVVKDAHEKGRIDKATYDAAIQTIVKNNIEGGSLVGGFKVVQRSGKSEIVLDEGSIEIPSGSKVEVIKKGGEISIIVRKSDASGVEGDVDKLQSLTGDGGEEKKEDRKTDGKGERVRHDWLEGHVDDESITTEFKDEFDLADLRKEYRQKKKKEAEAAEENKEEVDEEAEPSMFDKLFKRIKKTAEESPQDKLRRLSLENLGRLRGAGDERKTIVGIAYVLKQFLELKYEIPHELTYTELIKEIRNRPMNNDLRARLITFFKNTSMMVYASGPKTDNAQKAYSLAERAIKELS